MSAAKIQAVLWVGGDSWQRERVIAELSRIQFGDQEVERLRFDAARGQTARALEEVLTSSLFSPCRLVLLEQVDRISKPDLKTSANLSKEDSPPSENAPRNDIDLLLDYLAHPRGDTPLVMTAEDQKSVSPSLLEALGKKRIKILRKTSLEQIEKSVLQRCGEQKIRLTQEALAYFLECCGDDVDAAQQELRKLLLWAQPGQEIGPDDCRRLIQNAQEEDIWALSRAVEEKNPKKALNVFNRLIEQGDEPIAVLGRLSALFRSLLHGKAILEEKIPEAEWSRRTGKRGFGLEQTMKRSREFSAASLRRGISLLRQADEDLKGGKSEPLMVTERLILDLCQVEKTGAFR